MNEHVPAEIEKKAQMDATPQPAQFKDLAVETKPKVEDIMDIDETQVQTNSTIKLDEQEGTSKSQTSTCSNSKVSEDPELVDNEIDGTSPRATSSTNNQIDDDDASITEAGYKLDGVIETSVEEMNRPSSPLQVISPPPNLVAPASEQPQFASVEAVQITTDNTIEPDSILEPAQQEAASLQPDYKRQFLAGFANKGFTPQTCTEIMVEILEFTLSLKAELGISDGNNKALHHNIDILSNRIEVSNQRYNNLATAHESLLSDFIKFQKRQSQREIRKSMEDAKKELTTITAEVKKLREPDVKIEYLSEQVKSFESRFKKMEEDLNKEIKASKEARAGLVTQKKRNNGFSKYMEEKLTSLREEVKDMYERLDELTENTDAAPTGAVKKAHGTAPQSHQQNNSCANVDELGLVKEELIEVRQELEEVKQIGEGKDSQLQNDLEVLRDHVAEYIQDHEVSKNFIPLPKAAPRYTENSNMSIFTPAGLVTLKNSSGLLGTALCAIMNKQDETNEQLDTEIVALGKRIRSSWEAIHTLTKQADVTRNLATETAVTVNKVIRATAAQARRLDEGMDNLDDRILVLAREGGTPYMKKQCMEHVGGEDTSSNSW